MKNNYTKNKNERDFLKELHDLHIRQLDRDEKMLREINDEYDKSFLLFAGVFLGIFGSLMASALDNTLVLIFGKFHYLVAAALYIILTFYLRREFKKRRFQITDYFYQTGPLAALVREMDKRKENKSNST